MFRKVLQKLVSRIMSEFYECLSSGREPKINYENYNKICDIIKSASKFYDFDKSRELIEEEKKQKDSVEGQLENANNIISESVILEEDPDDKVTGHSEKALLIYKNLEKSRKLFSDIIEPIKEVLGENYINKMMKLVSQKKFGEYGYTILHAQQNLRHRVFSTLPIIDLNNETRQVINNYETDLQEKEKVDNVKYKRRFPLSEEKNYNDGMLSIYNDIKNRLSKGELFVIGFESNRYK